MTVRRSYAIFIPREGKDLLEALWLKAAVESRLNYEARWLGISADNNSEDLLATSGSYLGDQARPDH